MKERSKLLFPILAGAIAVFGGGTLLAQQAAPGTGQNDKELVKLMSDHHLTLAKAVEAAERHANGHAISATAQMQGADGVVNVMVVTNQATTPVTVDIKSGAVRGSAADKTAGAKHGAGMSNTGKAHEQPKKRP